MALGRTVFSKSMITIPPEFSSDEPLLASSEARKVATDILRNAHRLLLRTFMVCIAAVALYLAHKFLFQPATKAQIEGGKDAASIYVVMSSDTNLHYLLSAPFAVQFWLNMNLTSIVMLCGTEEEYRKSNATKEAVSQLQRLGAVLIFLKNQKLKSNNFAQNIRNYAAATDFVQQNLDNSTILMTSDVDYFPLRLKDHVPKPAEGKEIAFFNPHCCADVIWKKERFPQYPMGTIAMTVKWWKEVMDIHPEDIADGPYIEAKTNAVFDNELFDRPHDKSYMWFLDQAVFGLQFGRMTQRNKDYAKLVTTHRAQKRLDRRSDWTPQIIASADLDQYDDAHIKPDIYDDGVWNSTREFYKKVLTEEQMKPLVEYRNRASKLVNATFVELNHYHPG
ncbi:unnamed protein product [Bursaphelenchus xylophilus]|uniref:(pine wood nematode) hypothetical protein n=1 Tax=Bursaphelenchus xylophilus TaxID=6326 RepID=A0A1I7RQD5_BURXY|nr:unnamed protein product [Bursaphelenchus xylophilus]CAG9104405.1 unnamed protein product [Bursaphelenchus xylophilus]